MIFTKLMECGISSKMLNMILMLHHALNMRIPLQMNFHVKSVLVRAIAYPLYYFNCILMTSQASYL